LDLSYNSKNLLRVSCKNLKSYKVKNMQVVGVKDMHNGLMIPYGLFNASKKNMQ